MSRIEQRLRETVGLDAASLGPASLARAVRLERKRLGVATIEEYEQVLESSPAARMALLEAVLVTETWFFRDRETFGALTRLVLDSWLPSHRAGILRLLSLPCASGEEPYSLVMALLDAGVAPDRFQVDAADVSVSALARARLAVYGKNSFRNGELGFRARYFRSTRAGFVLNGIVRDRVRFYQRNLLEPGLPSARRDYDFIFFRNLLIYLDEAARLRALDQIARMLAPDGVLFVGPSEQSLVLDYGFVSANLPFAFACRKATYWPERAARHLKPEPALPGSPAKLPLRPNPAHHLLTSADNSLARPGRGGARRSLPDDLECARRLADAGRLAEAATICEAHLSQSRASAQAYYLLGVVHDAGGKASAIDYYRKALYLEPNHYDSLMRMALLASKNGDAAGARNFRRRAARLQAHPPPP
jgi:chemotaxis protein methyltransferase WspC